MTYAEINEYLLYVFATIAIIAGIEMEIYFLLRRQNRQSGKDQTTKP